MIRYRMVPSCAEVRRAPKIPNSSFLIQKEFWVYEKRILTGLLACCLSLSLALPGLAAGSIPAQDEVAQVVTALGIMAGDANGDLHLSRPVNRAEFITMAVRGQPPGRPGGRGLHLPLS